LIDVKKVMMDDLARADDGQARQDEQTGSMMGRGCLAEGLRTVCLSRFVGDSGGPTYRPVGHPKDAQILVTDVPRLCEDWQVAVLANGTDFVFDRLSPLTVAFAELGWRKKVSAYRAVHIAGHSSTPKADP
jgi:hypothetical protein